MLIGLTYYYPNLSGLTKYVELLAENLVKKNIEVEVICSKHEKSLKLRESIRGVSVFRVGGLRLGKGIIMPTYPFLALAKVRKSDVVNCHLPSIESFWLAFWSKIFKRKLIVTYHCFYGNNSVSKILINIIHNIVCLFADKIVVNTKDYVIENGLLGFFRKKLVEISPPMETKNANKDEDQEITEKICFKKKEKIIGFLGRISSEKNIELIFETIPFLNRQGINFKIVLAGPDDVVGEEKYQQKIDRLIKKYKNKVVKIGKIKNPVAFLTKCDCLVLPSNDRLESFGMVQVEAMRCGTPSVATNLPGMRIPVAESGGGELFKNRDSRDLADKLVTVLKQGKKYYQKRMKLEMFDYKESIDRYEEIFLEN